MSNKPIKITLFHMENCIHCDRFMPVWKNLSGSEQQNIGFADYERTQLDSMRKDEATINGKPILGFPTIKINVMDREYNYQGERNETAILSFVRDKLKNRLSGVESEVESEESERSIFSGMEGGNSTSESVQFGGDGSPKAEEDDSPKFDDGAETDAITTDNIDISSNEDSSKKDSPKKDSPKKDSSESEKDSPKKESPKRDADTSPVDVSTDVRPSERSSIFSRDESEPAVEQSGGFRMSEFDRLLMKEINVLSDIPTF